MDDGRAASVVIGRRDGRCEYPIIAFAVTLETGYWPFGTTENLISPISPRLRRGGMISDRPVSASRRIALGELQTAPAGAPFVFNQMLMDKGGVLFLPRRWGTPMATRNQIASLLDQMVAQRFVASDPYEREWTLAEFKWLCEQTGLDPAYEGIERGIALASYVSPVW